MSYLMENELEPEHRLWQAVILTAIADAEGINLHHLRKNKNYEKDKAESAIRWLLRDNQWFPWICDAAGYSPDSIREKAKKLIVQGLHSQPIYTA